jgi:predicted nucleic acid-binding protein
MYLVDANILVYSTDEESEHHVAAWGQIIAFRLASAGWWSSLLCRWPV